jgi:hypothetical protein
MAMKLLTGLPARLFLIVFLGCCAAVAQRDDGVRGAQGTIRNGVPVSESFLVAGPGLEMGGLVTGQPYSAERVSEHTQTLTNGTHIDQKREMSRMYRDSEGRTRMERLVFLGPAVRTGAKDTAPRLIHIYDPVAGYSYTLDTQKHIAHRYTVPIPSESQKTARTAVEMPAPPAGQPVAGKAASFNGVLQQRGMKRVPLGTEMIDGIQVEGTRTSITTPTGVQGNDRPLTRVCEIWHAEELKITMLSKCTDPRSGNLTLRIQNLERSEPDPELFQVPADYTIVEETGSFTVGFGQR